MLGINLISLLLSSNVSQRCAERAGYEKNYEITSVESIYSFRRNSFINAFVFSFAKLACKGATFTYPNVTSSSVSVHSLSILN